MNEIQNGRYEEKTNASVENLLHAFEQAIQGFAEKDFKTISENILMGIADNVRSNPLGAVAGATLIGAGLGNLTNGNVGKASLVVLKFLSLKLLAQASTSLSSQQSEQVH